MPPKTPSLADSARKARKGSNISGGRQKSDVARRSVVAGLTNVLQQGWVFAVSLLIITFVAYYPAWHGGFIWDDDIYVSENPLLSAPDGLWRIWFSTESPSQYFPLTYTMFRWEYALWGLQPTGYHLVNIMFHGINALLIWRLLRRLNVPGARLAAAFFALHPVAVESVAWITELKNILSLLFCLLAARAWIEYLDAPEARKARWYGLTLALYAMALLSKTTACTLPIALLLVTWLKGRPLWVRTAGWRSPVVAVIPFAIAGAGMGLLAMWWERFHQGTEGRLFAVGITERVLIASHAIWFYAAKLVWPSHLAFSYPRWSVSATDPLAYGWVAAILVAGLAMFRARRWFTRGALVAILFYAATLAPMLGFLMLYTFRYTFVADHYQYAAMIGPVALAAAALMQPRHKWGGRGPEVAASVALIVPLLLAAGTWRQSANYTDIETLWRATLATNPESFMAHNNLGNLLLRQGKLDAAIVHLQKAIALRPDLAEARSNLGNALSEKGQLAEATAELRQAVQLEPELSQARNNLGTVLWQQGDYAGAIAEYREAVRIRPAFAEARKNLGNTLLQTGRVPEAIAQFQEALRSRPDLASAQNGLGNALLQAGQVDAALVHLDRAIELQPGLATAYNNRGTCLMQKGRPDAALLDFERAVELRPDYPEQQNNLGKALLALGRIDEAIARFQKALELRPDFAGARSNLAKAREAKGGAN